MLLFCPTCGTLMQIEEGNECHRFTCKACDFSYPVTKLVRSLTNLIKKKIFFRFIVVFIQN